MGPVLLVLLAGACSKEAVPPVLEEPGEAPDQIIWDFTTTESDSGRLIWVLKAQQARVFNTRKEVEATALRVDMYGEQRTITSTLTADSGVIDQRTGAMTVSGRVHVRSHEGYELFTSVLHWDKRREIFRTEAFVEVHHGDNLYTGYEMECDRNLDHLSIQREPRGVIVGSPVLDDEEADRD
ncbi:MAG: LPS export ABC transporter periplasmic protein LptC [Candidatus Krumholzibacteriota bacterium]|nr:LPS export ABC transporter periplasmic protein LptC [Candidatus Krumholzibacteriota bacterium]